MVALKRKINGDKWTLKVLSRAAFNELPEIDDGDQGVTYDQERLICFNEEYLTVGLVRHELFHAYWFYLHIPPDSGPDSIEETMALWFEERSETAGRQAKRLFKELTKAVAACKKEQK